MRDITTGKTVQQRVTPKAEAPEIMHHMDKAMVQGSDKDMTHR